MGAVQKNPALRQKLADKGVGFMQGGVVKAAEGLSVEDAIKAQSKYATKKFNPFDPNWMLGMSASGLQDPLAGQMYGQNAEPVTAATIEEEAGVIKPQEEGEDPNNLSGVQGQSLSDRSTTDLATDIQQMKDIQGKKGILGTIANSILGKAHLGAMESELEGRPEVTIAGDYTAGPKTGGPGNQGSTTGGGTAAPGAEATGSFTGYSSNANQGPAGGAGSGANDDGTSGTGGYGMFNKGAFISRRKKT